MKICHMTSAHPPEDGRIFLRECTSLAEAGYETYLVERGSTYDKNGVHIIGVGEFKGSRLDRIFKFSNVIYHEALKLDADIYHLHDPELLLYAHKLKKKGKKVIFDRHEDYVAQIKCKPYLPFWVAYILSKIYKKFEDYIFNKIDAIIIPCLRNGKHDLKGRVVTLDNYPKLTELYDFYDSTIEKYEKSVCHIGSLTKERGITEIIKAAYLSGSKIYIGGAFSPPEYKNEIETLPESISMCYLGILDRDQVLSLLQHCQIGLATLHNVGQYNTADNLPTKCYEYMSLGLPVILTKAKYNESINSKYHFGICVDAENEKEIAEAITFLLNNPDVAAVMGKNGREAIFKVFNWEREQNKLFDLYKSIINLN